MKLFRWILVLILTGVLTACSATQQNIQSAADRNVLNFTVGKEYAKIAATNATTTEGLFGREKAYGDRIGQSQLSNGDIVYKHAARNEASESSVNLGLFGGSEKIIDYRLMYFRVGSDGLIKDYANGVVSGEKINCVNYIGGLFQNCDNAQQLSTDIAQMDAAVLTSQSLPLSSWQ